MVDLLALQKQFILTHLRPGDTACDFTMGNGHDTTFLSKTVGERSVRECLILDICLAAAIRR